MDPQYTNSNQMTHPRIVILLLPIVLLLGITLSPNARAITVRGVIQKNEINKEILLKLSQSAPGIKSGDTIKINPTNLSVQLELSALKNGDYIVGEGNSQKPSNDLDLDAIERVGIQELLGTWRSNLTGVFFEFIDFNRLILHESKNSRLNLRNPSSTSKQYNYVLAPDCGSRFSIFLANSSEAGSKNSVHAGTLEIKDRKVNITVFNSATGGVAANVYLSPMRPPIYMAPGILP
jgi:hypothetical protein